MFDLNAVVAREVSAVEVIDVHTHLLPPTHGQLMLYGVDALLTYHYLVAETWMVMPLDSEADSTSTVPDAPPSKDEFFAWPLARQAELVFEELFVKRTPMSEACRGFITVLSELGLTQLLREAATKPAKPRLDALRGWFAQQEPAEYLERVCQLAKVKYVVMTNIPFVPEEAVHWKLKSAPIVSPRLKTALRVDPILAGDWTTVAAALRRNEPAHPETLEGCKAYLREWIGILKPVYLMASTPAGFKCTLTRRGVGRVGKKQRVGDEHAEPPSSAAGGTPTGSDLFEKVLLEIAVEAGLPIAIKIGAVRGVNPALRAGGDAVEVADLSWLREVCLAYPHVKLLVTVLSAENQHELCVLAQKFGNLHVYGCWWFCNNPSMIESITKMRLEMMGTAFTFNHTDCRVVDQLLYKWKHSRESLVPVLVTQYRKIVDAGWPVSEADIRRDVQLLCGGSYEAFLAK